MLETLLQQVDQLRAAYLSAIYSAMLYEVGDYWKTAMSEGSDRVLVADMVIHRVLTCFTLSEHEEDVLTSQARDYVRGLAQ